MSQPIGIRQWAAQELHAGREWARSELASGTDAAWAQWWMTGWLGDLADATAETAWEAYDASQQRKGHW